MEISVSIPVTVGGYTGQRDQWEEHKYDFVVTQEDGNIILTARPPTGRKITFNKQELGEAVKVIEGLGGS